MASLANLKPAERARLLGKPEGELGIAIGKVMNQTNAKIISTVSGSKSATGCLRSGSAMARRCHC
jgi:hypothetical protein